MNAFRIQLSSDELKYADDAILLSLAISNDKDDVLYALNRLGKKVLTAIDKNGNSFLHLAVINNSAEMVKLILENLPQEDAILLCKKVNNVGNTPLLLANKFLRTKQLYDHGRYIIKCLLPLTLDCSIKPLKALLNPQAVVKSYPEADANPVLADNIRMACEVINIARKAVSQSSTHPELNAASPEVRVASAKAIDQLRLTLNENLNLEVLRKKIIENGHADCTEYSDLALANLVDMKKDRTIRLEKVCFSNGDHEFVVMDRRHGSDINDPSTWGDNAVIVDAWAGVAFPAATNAPDSQLMGYYNIAFYEKFEKAYNLVCSFNRGYHKFKSGFSLECTPLLTAIDCDLSMPRGLAREEKRLAEEKILPEVKVHLEAKQLPVTKQSCLSRFFCCRKKRIKPWPKEADVPQDLKKMPENMNATISLKINL